MRVGKGRGCRKRKTSVVHHIEKNAFSRWPARVQPFFLRVCPPATHSLFPPWRTSLRSRCARPTWSAPSATCRSSAAPSWSTSPRSTAGKPTSFASVSVVVQRGCGVPKGGGHKAARLLQIARRARIAVVLGMRPRHAGQPAASDAEFVRSACTPQSPRCAHHKQRACGPAAARENNFKPTCNPSPTLPGALYDVVNSDALSLVEGDVFDRVYCLAR